MLVAQIAQHGVLRSIRGGEHQCVGGNLGDLARCVVSDELGERDRLARLDGEAQHGGRAIPGELRLERNIAAGRNRVPTARGDQHSAADAPVAERDRTSTRRARVGVGLEYRFKDAPIERAGAARVGACRTGVARGNVLSVVQL